MDAFRVTIMGVRGSVPVSDPAFAGYGGATTSVLVQAGETNIVLDAGTGILHLPPEVMDRSELTLLLTHAHLDHINGLSMCPYVLKNDSTLDIYAAKQNGTEMKDVLFQLYSPPVWPVTPDRFPAALRYHPLEPSFTIGGVHVLTMAGVHPGGIQLFRLSYGGKSVVLATDCTLTEAIHPAVVSFAKDCDLLLCDGQYSDEEWHERKGFGHNTWKTAALLGADCGAVRTRIVHHDPSHNDAFLDRAAAEVRTINPNCEIAREGEVITL